METTSKPTILKASRCPQHQLQLFLHPDVRMQAKAPGRAWTDAFGDLHQGLQEAPPAAFGLVSGSGMSGLNRKWPYLACQNQHAILNTDK